MKTSICSLLALGMCAVLFAPATTMAGENDMNHVQGYDRAVTGGGFTYHSPAQSVTKALLVRATKLAQLIEWESEPVPVDHAGKTVSFVWFFAISRDNVKHKFHLTAGKHIAVDFHNELGTKTGEWTVRGTNNATLTFKATIADRNEDLQGIAVLEVPAEFVEKGKPLAFAVRGDDIPSPEWYMTFEGKVQEEVYLYATDCVSLIGGKEFQSMSLAVYHVGPKEKVVVTLEDGSRTEGEVLPGNNTMDVNIPRLTSDRTVKAQILIGSMPAVSRIVVVKPAREMTIYVLPHSHTDIGYTEIQTAIEEKQMQNLKTGIEYARRTASYPEGARFIWNVEVAWAADLYLNRMTEQDKAEFFEAVKKGWVSLNGMYLNELTGLCRPEELLRLFKYSTALAEKCGTTIDAAMISDVPGYTWGTVTAMAQAGVKYFSVAPNSFDRIGDILVKWENKPFYWISPTGNEKVLVWIPYKGYALSHGIKGLSESFTREYMQAMRATDYPYDIAYLRWSGHGDNAVPEIEVAEFVKEWNAKYIYPKYVIASTGEAFSAFERKFGSKLPSVKGDWTPYWEDGAGSSALETAMNRASSDRLTQAQAVWTMRDPKRYPVPAFEAAWNNVLLYSEHTWGAWCSVSDPENKMTKEQWDIKQSYALQADKQSRALLEQPFAHADPSLVDVYNTTSWARTGIVTVSAALSGAGDRVVDMKNNPLMSQRLTDGTLAVMVKDIPPYSSRRLRIVKGAAHHADRVSIRGTVIDNGTLTVTVDAKEGTITHLARKGREENFADTKVAGGINGFLYLPGDNLANIRKDSVVKVAVKENGPLVASLLVESVAPSCNSFTREVRLTAGEDHVELINVVDKQRAEVSPVPGDGAFAQKGGKESINFAFPFNVAGGTMKIDIPLAVMEPEKDQIPSACKNWFTVGRWADVSNRRSGITWAALDAPLIEVGEISATLIGSQTDPTVWWKKVEPTQLLYSWAMNNHWGTNYRAYQEGIVAFRYALRPHGEFSASSASCFATAQSQPLLAMPAADAAGGAPLPIVASKNILVLALKPSDDGKAVMVTLFNCSDKKESTRIDWTGSVKPSTVRVSDSSEKAKGAAAGGVITIDPYGVLVLRAEY